MKQSSHRQPSCLHKNGSRKKLMERILQKNTEAQKGTEEEKRILLNAIPQQAFMIDTQETIVAANESLARSLGKSINEIIDSSVCDLFPPDVVERLRRRVDESIHTGKPVHFKDMWQGRYCAYDVQPVFDTEGKVARVAISVTDITECKRAEEALQESERRHRLLTEISSDVI
jgi:PAS domain S-box-containing protein